MAEAEGQKAIIEAHNSLSNANRTAELLKTIWPELVTQLPDLIKALAPQPGVLGESRIYSFPGLSGSNGNGSNSGDINKLLLSTSGLTLLNGLLNEGKLSTVVDQVKSLLQDPPSVSPPSAAVSEDDWPDLAPPTETNFSPEEI